MPEPRGHRVKSVYAARTTESPQPEFEYFLNGLAKSLGRAATIRTDGTHLTLLETGGVKDLFYERDFSETDVWRFSARMQERIDKAGHNLSTMRVKVDHDEPVRWVGFPPLSADAFVTGRDSPYLARKLALNLVLDEAMKDQRGIIEEGLIEEFGELPPIRPFSPHITVGLISKDRREEYCRQEAISLVPNNLAIPESLALNGLAVYLDRIHEADCAFRPAGAFESVYA